MEERRFLSLLTTPSSPSTPFPLEDFSLRSGHFCVLTYLRAKWNRLQNPSKHYRACISQGDSRHDYLFLIVINVLKWLIYTNKLGALVFPLEFYLSSKDLIQMRIKLMSERVDKSVA